MSDDEYFTCRDCKEIFPTFSETKLDGKSLCHECLDDRRFGKARKVCAARGFHQTRSCYGGLGYSKDDDDNVVFSGLVVKCDCDKGGRIELKTPYNGGFFITVPNPPKYWVIVEGAVTPLADDDVRDGALIKR